MAQFDESKVINILHVDKAEVGKKYWYADNIADFKDCVEGGKRNPAVLTEIRQNLFVVSPSGIGFCLLYPYEEPQKKRMTNRQLAEWVTKGNGEYTEYDPKYSVVFSTVSYFIESGNEKVKENIKIRPWDSEEWIEPTVDIYKRDCKGGK